MSSIRRRDPIGLDLEIGDTCSHDSTDSAQSEDNFDAGSLGSSCHSTDDVSCSSPSNNTSLIPRPSYERRLSFRPLPEVIREIDSNDGSDGGDLEEGRNDAERGHKVHNNAGRPRPGFGSAYYKPSFRSSLRSLNTTVDSTAHEQSMPKFQRESHTQHQRMRRSLLNLTRQNENWKFLTLHFVKYTFWTVWAVLVMIVVGHGTWAFPDGNVPSACADEHERNKKTCAVGDSLNEASYSLLFLTGFVLAGFIMSSRDLWLKRRTSYCALCGATRNLLINTISLVPRPHKRLFARWSVLGYELSVLKARLLMDSAEGKHYLTSLNLVHEAEWEAMVPGDRHTTVWFWVQSKAKELNDEGEISEDKLRTICAAVTLIRDKANDLMSCLDRDQPPPYVFVCALLININLLFYGTAQGMKFAVWMQDAGGFKIWSEPGIYLNILTLYLFTAMFALLFDVCALLYNPFGPRYIDLPHHTVSRGIRKLAKSLAKSSHPSGSARGLARMQTFREFLDSDALVAQENVQMKSAQLGLGELLVPLTRRRRTFDA